MEGRGTSSKDLYDRCCQKALLESLLLSKFLNDIYGYAKTSRLVRDAINLYNEKHRLMDDFGKELVKALTEDMEKDVFLEGMRKFDPDSYEAGKDSMKRTIDAAGQIMSELSISYDEQLRFILFFEGITTTCDPFDFDKLEMNRNRVLKADRPQDSYPALKDQFNQIFEEVYRPYSRDFANVVSRYPGMEPETAYAAVEDLLSVTGCYIYKDEYKSDIRETRNAFAHEKYRIGEKLTLTLNDGSTKDYDTRDMMFMISMMQYKCMFVNMVLPIMNIGVLRSMESRF